MVTKFLKDVEVGGIVKIKESGVPTEFYVAKHDYESELNGEGRTLLVRKNVITTTEGFNLKNSYDTYTNEYNRSNIDRWLCNQYLPTLDESCLRHVSATVFPSILSASGSYRTVSLQRSVFLLSLTEFGLTASYAAEEGTVLPISLDILIGVDDTGTAVAQWTRSPSTSEDTRVVNLSATGTDTTNVANAALAVRPAITVPADIMLVLDDGTLTDNTVTISAGETDLGEKRGKFEFSYSVSTLCETGATITEYVCGAVREFNAEEGVEQVATINADAFSEGNHTVVISAESDTGAKAQTVFSFKVPPFAAQDHGTVQEFQSECGEAVYPVTQARAVLMNDGRSLQNMMDAEATYEVGDIRYSTGRDLGDEWLLCNGDTVKQKDYPGLRDVYPQGASVNLTDYKARSFSIASTTSAFVYGAGNGRAFALHNNGYGADLTHVTIIEPGKEPETHTLVGLESPPVTSGTDCIKFTGGKYIFFPTDVVVATQAGDGTVCELSVYTSEDLISWELEHISFRSSYVYSTSSSFTLMDIEIAPDGKVFTLMRSGSHMGYGCGDSFLDPIDLVYAHSSTGTSRSFGQISIVDGRLYSTYCQSASSSSSTSHVVEYDPVLKTAKQILKTSTSRPLPLAYAQGKYVTAVNKTLFHADDPNVFESLVLTSDTGVANIYADKSDTATGWGLHAVKYGDVERVLVVGEFTAKSKAFIVDVETGAIRTVSVPVFTEGSSFVGVFPLETGLFAVKFGTATVSGVVTNTLYIYEFDGLQAYQLPTISADSAYAYIKAKEAQE